MDLDRYHIAEESELGEALVPIGLTGVTLGALYLSALIKDKRHEKELNRKLKERLPKDLDSITDRQVAENFVRDLRAVGYKVLGKDDGKCAYQIDSYHKLFPKMSEYKIDNAVVVCIEDQKENPSFCVWVNLSSANIRCKLISDRKNVIVNEWKKRISKV